MKRLALISSVTDFAFAQTPTRHGTFSFSAATVTTDGAVRHLFGGVVIESEGFRLKADNVDYNDDTGELVTHGDAHITLK